MTIEEFERALRCGLGRCVTKLNACENKEVYRAAVLDCCMNNPCFDTQCEGTRAEYLYDLISAFNDAEYFLLPVIKKLRTTLDDSGWDFAHLCDLTAEFARRGNEKSINALKEIYGELYSILLKRRDCDFYDGARDNFERLCTIFSNIYGLHAFVKMAGDMGELFIANNNYSGSDFEWFYIHFENIAGKANLKKFMRSESEKSPAVRAFYNEIQKTVAPSTALPSPKRRTLAENEIISRAKEAVEEINPNKKADLIGVFRRYAFPLNHSYLIEYSKSHNEALREAAFEALEKCKSGDVREYALQLIEGKHEPAHAINLLIANFQPDDGELLLDCLNSLEIDRNGESGWHGTVISILSAFDDGIKLPKSALIFVYEKSLCSSCRADAIRVLSKRRWLTSEMKNECLYDSNADIREYARKIFN